MQIYVAILNVFSFGKVLPWNVLLSKIMKSPALVLTFIQFLRF